MFVGTLGKLFSSDPAVLSYFEEVRWPMGAMIFFMCYSMHFELILLSLKRGGVVLRAALCGSGPSSREDRRASRHPLLRGPSVRLREARGSGRFPPSSACCGPANCRRTGWGPWPRSFIPRV